MYTAEELRTWAVEQALKWHVTAVAASQNGCAPVPDWEEVTDVIRVFYTFALSGELKE